jgi:formate--tetrahydrofolate ligase
MKLADVVVTEAGFASDLGAEKFYDIKCRYGNLVPDATVLVATIRALKMHGGMDKKELDKPNLEAVKKGFENLQKHIENIKLFGVPLVVAVNKFHADTDEEINWVIEEIRKQGIRAVVSDIFAKGPDGGKEMAEMIEEAIAKDKNEFDFLYPLEMPLQEKIRVIARCVYGAGSVTFLNKAKKQLEKFEDMGYQNIPVCIAKTQTSLSDTKNLLGRPKDFEVVIREAKLSAGAGFVVAISGEIMTMPGLPKKPAAEIIDIDEKGQITGLF